MLVSDLSRFIKLVDFAVLGDPVRLTGRENPRGNKLVDSA